MASTSTIEPLPVYTAIIVSLQCLGGSPPRFHWIIFVQDPSSEVWSKFHATFVLNKWNYERNPFSLQQSDAVAAATIIGSLGSRTSDDLHHILKEIPMKIPDVDISNEPRFTCLVWLREALRRIHNAGIIYCPDENATERELIRYGNIAAQCTEDDFFRKARLHKAESSR
ncbi:hypothetical protein BDW22DRAFT_689171 [Trametopsis cervina]|nr:hypothetical protein BDW22DRAFT_689171 [Trametopsis cervina]